MEAPLRIISAVDLLGKLAVPMVLLGWGLLQNNVMRCSDVLDVPIRIRGVSGWSGQYKEVMPESNDDWLRTRLLTRAKGVPMA